MVPPYHARSLDPRKTWAQEFKSVQVWFMLAVIRSDGTVVASGLNGSQQCDIPPLEDGVWYTQAAAGWNHKVLLRSDGRAVACGEKKAGHCDIPVLDEGQSYAQVSAAYSASQK